MCGCRRRPKDAWTKAPQARHSCQVKGHAEPIPAASARTPDPATLAAVQFDPEWVRADIRETVDIARANGCVLEMIIKDTHTCNHKPWRFDEWCRIAKEEAEVA